uniref:Uncharacterized protein LOC114330064 n=1 Tax=Diabrotica virgifera virgifera TaxID=50390 RepID=A0A6P7FGJ3_DIAVI
MGNKKNSQKRKGKPGRPKTSGKLDSPMMTVEENSKCLDMLEKEKTMVLEAPEISKLNQSCNKSTIVSNDYKSFKSNITQLASDAQSFLSVNEELTENNANDIDLKMDIESHQNMSSESAVTRNMSKASRSLHSDQAESSSKSSGSLQNGKVENIKDIVAEYKNKKVVAIETTQEKVKPNSRSSRRHPVRTVRNTTKNLTTLQEDFPKNTSVNIVDKENKAVTKSPDAKLPEEYPVHVHEKHDSKPEPKKRKFFANTIRDLQDSCTSDQSDLSKKPPPVPKNQLSSCTAANRKSVPKKLKKPASPVGMGETVPLGTLKPLINSTTDLLKQYFISTKENPNIIKSDSPLSSFENKVEILRNQAYLFAIVNNLGKSGVTEKFKDLNLHDDGKK